MNPSLQLKVLDEQDVTQATITRSNKYGRLIPLLPDARGRPRFMLGPNYLIFLISFTCCASLLCWVMYVYFDKFSIFWNIIVIISNSSFLFAYLRVGFSKPGIQFATHEANQSDRESLRFCKVCELVREIRTQHCQDCDVCILDCDHHCPWVGKCVGSNNLCAFYTFLVLTFLNLIVVFVATTFANVENNLKTNV